MRQRRLWWAVVTVALLAGGEAAIADSFGLGVRTGMLLPAAGSYNAEVSTAELLEQGYSHGLFLRQQISRHYGIEAGVDLGWAAFAQAHREDADKTPHFVLPAVTFCNRMGLPLGPVVPYAAVGVGIFPWRFTREGLTGDPVTVEGEALQKMTAGLVGGAGVELKLSRWAAIFVETRATYLLSRDRFLFGEHFSEQTVLTVGGGVVFSPWGGRR
ncbi:MAG: hypothetical protein ACUVTG_01080 [Candidatus Oleimicrobiaceae bacterium]